MGRLFGSLFRHETTNDTSLSHLILSEDGKAKDDDDDLTRDSHLVVGDRGGKSCRGASKLLSTWVAV